MLTALELTNPSPVLVTGCSSGIGRATALRLAASGQVVYASARRLDAIGDLTAVGCHVLALDVTNEESMQAAVRKIAGEYGSVAALVNNAGYGEYGPVEEVPLDAVRRQFETNVFGLLRMCQLVLPGMRERGGGCIVNVSSMGGRMTLPGGGVYHASKYAVEALSDALRFEVRGFGVAVTLVEPGPVRTAFVEEAVTAGGDGGPYAAFRRGVALRNAAGYDAKARGTINAEDVAAVIERALTAARPRARYLVGATSRLTVRARMFLPTAVWDALLRSQFPTPA